MSNQVVVLGRAGRDPESRSTTSGTTLATLSVASDQYVDKQKGTIWWDVTVFGKTAEVVLQYVRKGTQLVVFGHLQQQEWTDKTTGDKRKAYKLIADRVQLCGNKREDDPDGYGDSDGGRATGRTGPAAAGDDDIPF